MRRGSHFRRARWRRATAVGLAASLLTALVMATWVRMAAASSVAGNAGTDTSLKDDSSAVSVSGTGTFAGLKIHVNQTKALNNEAISITWTGGVASTSGFAVTNFLQIFQCWGDDDGKFPGNPGPPPEQCEFGGEPTGANNPVDKFPISSSSDVYSRIIGQQGQLGLDPTQGYMDSSTGILWKPFRAVDGSVVNVEINPQFNRFAGGSSWLNPFFSFNTTNEDDFAFTHADGTGSELFQADTGLEAPGLGCGQQVEVHPDGSKSVPNCWLVIVPRATPAQENPGGFGSSVDTSPLTPIAWSNRIAIPLQFNRIDSTCQIGANERRISGSEMATPAVTNWQPTLCSLKGAAPYNYASLSEDLARRQLVGGAAGGAGLAIVSQPIGPATLDPANPVVYAPLTLSAAVIGFNIERKADFSRGVPPADEVALNGVRVAHIDLTPRLVAKLLTMSYSAQLVDILAGVPAGYEWVKTNPTDLASDPDFVQFNPEFKYLLAGNHKDASTLLVEEPTSDAASLLWKWVLADPEAKTWLDGTPDPWGMKVNPIYSTNAAANSTKTTFGTPMPNSYPKSDPYCYQDPRTVANGQKPRALCALDWGPYAANLQAAGQSTRAANDGAKDDFDPFAASADTAWVSEGPQKPGQRFIMSVTDSATAARYGLQTALLSRAGDDAATRTFAAADQAGIVAAEQAMTPSAAPGVLTPDPATTTAGAYPLTMLTYAAALPNSLDVSARNDYAAFVTYGAGLGQKPGSTFGDLPPGYVPLPADLAAQSATAAGLIRNGVPTVSAAGASPGATPASPPPGSAASDSPSGSSAQPDGGSSSGAAPLASATLNYSSGRLASPSGVASGVTAPPRPRPVKVAEARSAGRTPRDVLGAIRYALPTALAVGVAAAFGALLLDWRRRRLAAIPA